MPHFGPLRCFPSYPSWLDINGGAVGAELTIAATTDDELMPDVVARPGPVRDYMAVWQRSSTDGQEIRTYHCGDPGVASGGFAFGAAALWNYESPAVGVGRPGFLIAYESDTAAWLGARRHIYAPRYVPYGAFLPVTLKP